MFFYDDVQITNFLNGEYNFKFLVIDEITHDKYLQSFLVIHPHYSAEKSLNSVNCIPTSVFKLEIFYEFQYKI